MTQAELFADPDTVCNKSRSTEYDLGSDCHGYDNRKASQYLNAHGLAVDGFRKSRGSSLAALDTLKGEVIGQCMARHRHQEFLKFLKAIDRATPQKLDIHCIADNYATHKHPRIKGWLVRHARFHLPFYSDSDFVFVAQSC
jgi:hypothetical protein